MKKKLLLLTIAAATLTTAARAQFSEFDQGNVPRNFTLSGDNNTLTIGGRISFYYEDRVLKTGETNLDHNGFDIKDIDLDLLGKTKNKFVYELHLSPVDLATAAATNNTDNSENPGIKAAYLAYVGWKIKIKLGYDKMPYSQGNLSDVYATPLWSHANLVSGDYFSRRDMGLTLYTDLLHGHIHVYAGAYSGLGENYFEYNMDESGNPEFVGRIEYSNTPGMKYTTIDEANSPVLQWRVGLNGRYENKDQPAGVTVGAKDTDATGSYNPNTFSAAPGIRLITGKKSVYGGDAIVKYKGFSATFEEDIVNMKPQYAGDALFMGQTGYTHVIAGGFCASLNYNIEKYHSAATILYSNENPNDLAPGGNPEQWLDFAYCYKVSGFASCFKVEYLTPMVEDKIANPLKYTSEIRFGYAIVF